jgi:hypothetical protein
MNGYVSQLIAEGHIAELRAQAARRRLRTQAAQAAQAAPGRGPRKSTVWPARLRLDAESARRARPLAATSGTRVATVRVQPTVDC